jgi:hypothetical protein
MGKEKASLVSTRLYKACRAAVQVTFNKQYRHLGGLLDP